MQWNKFLGQFYGDDSLKGLLDHLNLTDGPKLKRGEEDAYVKNYAAGIELTFTDEEALGSTTHEYPEHALVLTNIRFYGPSSNAKFNAFAADLPGGLRFGMAYDEAVRILGPEGGDDSDKTLVRWDLPDQVLFAKFGVEDKLRVVSIQLPGA